MRAIQTLLTVTLAASATAQSPHAPANAFRSAFEKAYLAYQAGQFETAAAQLRSLERQKPANFDVRELLGLTYAAEAQPANALEQFQAAVRISPSTVSARNNLATALVGMGRLDEAEAEWRAALAVEPGDYTANRNLARLRLKQGSFESAIPLLVTASKANPEALDNRYDLALAYMATGQYGQAREQAGSLLRQKDAGEVHALLGQIDEKQARYVDAVNEFSTAAHLEPSEENLFAWAGELMAHRAYEPAIKVFEEGTRRHPESPRLWVGQGMAFYARGEYEPAVRALLAATDLNAEDPRTYLFLSKAFVSSPSQAEAVIDRFHRYALLKPNDALAQYDYAIGLWKGRRMDTSAIDYPAVQALLERSIALDGNDAEVHLQLGVLCSDQHAYERAQAEFERAVQLDPAMADAHFRLGRAYLRAGQKEQAQQEFDQFKHLQAEHQARLDKERAEVKLFVLATQSAASTEPSANATPKNGPAGRAP